MSYELDISNIIYETPDAMGVSLAVPADLHKTFGFKPGQFIMISTEMNGATLGRCYSISSSPGQNQLHIVIKRVPDGLFSSHAHNAFKVGQKLTVSKPSGLFCLDRAADKATKNYVAFAAGSGITPIISIITDTLVHSPNSRFTLFYGNRTMDEIVFRQKLNDLKDEYIGRFALFHFLSEQVRDIEFLNGRIDDAHILDFVKRRLFVPDKVNQFFVCGPNNMIETITTRLRSLGVGADKICAERFIIQATPAALKKHVGKTDKASKSAVQLAPKEVVATVEIMLDGTQTQLEMTADDASIIDVAQRKGLRLPFSCRGGMCGTCRCKLQHGAVDLAVNYCLEPWEIESGFVLACQLKPKSKKITLNFDSR